MSRREVRQTINSQVRMVFFLPLAAAALHILMAFSMIRKLLLLFSLTDVKLFCPVHRGHAADFQRHLRPGIFLYRQNIL